MTYRLLSGMRVIESSAFVAAPLCGLTLAQMGADVIRFDLIGGGIDYNRLPMMPGGRSLYWTSLNKGKRSIAIDIRKPEGRDLLRSLVVAPDPKGGILLTNVPTRFLAHASLAKSRPDLISCTIEGNPDGSTAIDYTVNCATGYPMITGNGSRSHPINHALPAWDVACAYQAAFAIAAAVARRQRDGRGAELRLALSDVAFAVMSHLGVLAESELIEKEREAIGNDIYGAFGRDFATQDGARVMVAAVSDRQWTSLVEACDMAGRVAALEQALGVDFRREQDRFEYRDVIANLVRRWIGQHTLAEVGATFDRLGVCWGLFRTTRELLLEDPRVSAANPMFTDVTTEGIGRHRAAGAAIRLDEARAPTVPAPLLGEHTDAVLAEILGLSDSAIRAMHDRGVVAGPERDPLAPRPRRLEEVSQ